MIESDHFYFRLGEEINIDTHERLRLDVITLENEDTMVKIAMSYGLAQSIKLEAFEEEIKEAIKKNGKLTRRNSIDRHHFIITSFYL